MFINNKEINTEMDSIIFLHSKGANTRRKIIKILHKQTENDLHNAVMLAKKTEISKVSIKKHIDLLVKNEYVKKINPESKPIFLMLTEKGTTAAKKYMLH